MARLSPQMTRVFALLTQKAKELRESAGHAGAMHDNGAATLLNEIEIYKAGLEGRIPNGSVWQEAARLAAYENDPEYAEYLRMKAKFGA